MLFNFLRKTSASVEHLSEVLGQISLFKIPPASPYLHLQNLPLRAIQRSARKIELGALIPAETSHLSFINALSVLCYKDRKG